MVRANGTTANYPDAGSQANIMSSAAGIVVAAHNGAVVPVEANRLVTIVRQRQIAALLPGRNAGWPATGIAISRRGAVYVNESFIHQRHGCIDVIAEIGTGQASASAVAFASNEPLRLTRRLCRVADTANTSA